MGPVAISTWISPDEARKRAESASRNAAAIPSSGARRHVSLVESIRSLRVTPDLGYQRMIVEPLKRSFNRVSSSGDRPQASNEPRAAPAIADSSQMYSS